MFSLGVFRWLLLCFLSCFCFVACGGGTRVELQTDQQANTLQFEIDFVNQQSRDQVVLVYNNAPPGSGAIKISSIELTDDADGAYELLDVPSSFPVRLAPGKAHGIRLRVRMYARATSIRDSQIRIRSTGADNTDLRGQFFIKLVTKDARPMLRLDCGVGLSFCAVPKGQTVTKRCFLENIGGGTLFVEDLKFVQTGGGKAVDFKRVSSVPVQIESGEKKPLLIRYSPSDDAPLEDRGYFTFKSNGLTTPGKTDTRLYVTGNQEAPCLRILPHALSCQSQQDCQALGDSLFCEHIPSLGSSVCTGLYEHEPRLYPALFDRKTHRAGAPVTLVSTGRKPLTLFGILFEKTRKPVTFVKTPSLETLRFPIVLQPKEKREWAVDHAGGSSPGTLVLVESDGVNVPRSALRVMGGFHGCVLKYRGVGTVEAFTSRAKRIELRNAGDKACNIKKIYWKDGSSPAYSFSVPKESSWWLFPDNHVSLFFIDIAYDRAKDAQDRYQTTKLVIESNSLAEPKVEIYLEAIGR